LKQAKSLMIATFWSYLGELSARLAPPITTLLASRFLVPAEFGTIAAALMLSTFCQIFWEAGLNKALVQRASHLSEAFNFAFLFNIATACMLCIVINSQAEIIAISIFNDDKVSVVINYMCIYILFGAASSAPIALLQKALNFRFLFFVRFTTAWTSMGLSVLLLSYDYGYMSLIYGLLASNIIQFVLLFNRIRENFTFEFDLKVSVQMLQYCSWVFLTAVLSWLFLWLDALIIAKYLGPSDLGLYRMASQIAMFGMILIFMPIQPVLFAELSARNSRGEKIDYFGSRVIKLAAIVAIPLAVGLAIFSSEVLSLLLGDKWKNADFIFSMLILMHGFSWIVGFNGEFYRAIGKPKLETIVNAGVIGLYLITYFSIIAYGIEIFTAGRFLLSLIALIFHLLLFSHYFNLNLARNFWDIFLYTTISTVISGASYVIISKFVNLNIEIYFVISMLMSMLLTYFIIFHFMERHLFDFFRRKILNKLNFL
jgi:O-antigen/teichoic acid export membrane protein